MNKTGPENRSQNTSHYFCFISKFESTTSNTKDFVSCCSDKCIAGLKPYWIHASPFILTMISKGRSLKHAPRSPIKDIIKMKQPRHITPIQTNCSNWNRLMLPIFTASSNVRMSLFRASVPEYRTAPTAKMAIPKICKINKKLFSLKLLLVVVLLLLFWIVLVANYIK